MSNKTHNSTCWRCELTSCQAGCEMNAADLITAVDRAETLQSQVVKLTEAAKDAMRFLCEETCECDSGVWPCEQNNREKGTDCAPYTILNQAVAALAPEGE